jgi:hypothetical protein
MSTILHSAYALCFTVALGFRNNDTNRGVSRQQLAILHTPKDIGS